ncbi:MAG: YqaA family protein [Alphaproteobacteria bacterium]|jgi:membrane protein YqaA with SNARE-associated domain|nr:YqaA family protein [Alphaproteobacteria bacterium]MDP6517813.1 YqaA family protein [Alphaproteobacteria bacterium]
MIASGYASLALSAFLAATLIPASSEVVLSGLLASGEFDRGLLLAVASTANTLGSVVNWLLGRFCLRWRDRRWFPVKREALDRASRWFGRWGVWSLLLAWVPIIGDPLTLAAGVLKVDFLRFLALVALAKTTRYAALLGLLDWVVG